MPFRDFSAEFPKNWQLEINGVVCNVYHGPDDEGYGISESYGPEGRRAIVHFICYWDDRLTLIAGLVGTVDYTGGTIIRNDPFAYPLASFDDRLAEGPADGVFPLRLFCTSILSVQGQKMWTDPDGSNTGMPGWPGYCYAIIAAEFTSPPYLIEDLLGSGILPPDPSFNDLTYQQYIISEVEVAGEVFSPPTGAFVFAGGAFVNQPLLDVGASQIRSRYEITTTRVRMPLVPMTKVAELEGTVNSDPFIVGGMLFPKGAVLFLGCRPTSRTDPYNGGIIWDVAYKFMANGQGPGQNTPLDWNYFLDPGGAWSQVTTKAGDPVFDYADSSQLFFNAIT